ncbi:hypothetical protein TNCV_923881 [Trichonephila clavipes]|nr:hypothetical protein TNCV_923881 [Trichonephila clavipes]
MFIAVTGVPVTRRIADKDALGAVNTDQPITVSVNSDIALESITTFLTLCTPMVHAFSLTSSNGSITPTQMSNDPAIRPPCFL